MFNPAHSQRGALSTWIIIVVVILFALFMVNGLMPIVSDEERIYGPSPSPSVTYRTVPSGGCCDTGNGANCRPQTDSDKKFTFKGEEYGLLKSNVTLSEMYFHLKDSGEKFNDDPIIINTVDGWLPIGHPGMCQGGDALRGGGDGCVSIPDEMLVYVCKDKCHETTNDPYGFCSSNPNLQNKEINGRAHLPCYGEATTVYDVYFRLSDYPNPGIPELIRECGNPDTVTVMQPKQMIVFPPHVPPEQSLQLRNFEIVEIPEVVGSSSWVSPWCKPAIYLYPPKQLDVNVLVNTVGKMTLTIPQYPSSGWKVTANPDGRINHSEGDFDYLYYEAEIPDQQIEAPKKGFVKRPSEIEGLLKQILPQAGLNEKETNQFMDYWIKVLPKEVPYYFIGLVSTSNLDQIAPLNISPKPDKTIRVTVYFQALDGPINVETPKIETPQRRGFTVVEWGGIFKKDPKHPFSCLM